MDDYGRNYQWEEFCIGAAVGAAVAATLTCIITLIASDVSETNALNKQWRDSLGTHSYHLAETISYDGRVLVRRVISPSSIDDNTIETIIDGKLISRIREKP